MPDEAAAERGLPSRTIAADAPFLIVLNVGSGKHDAGEVRATIEASLNEAKRSFTLHEVTEASELPRVASEDVAKARAAGAVVVAAGGDGTINAVAHATLGSGC